MQFGIAHSFLGFPVAQRVKHLPVIQETWVQSLGREDPLEKEIATHFSTLAWKIRRSLVSYSPWDCRVTHDWATSLHSFLLWFCLSQFLSLFFFFLHSYQDAQIHHLEENKDYYVWFCNFPYGESRTLWSYYIFKLHCVYASGCLKLGLERKALCKFVIYRLY